MMRDSSKILFKCFMVVRFAWVQKFNEPVVYFGDQGKIDHGARELLVLLYVVTTDNSLVSVLGKSMLSFKAISRISVLGLLLFGAILGTTAYFIDYVSSPVSNSTAEGSSTTSSSTGSTTSDPSSNGTVTVTVKSEMVGIYIATPCLNYSTTTYQIISSSQTYTNITIYPINSATLQASEYSATVTATVLGFTPTTTTVYGSATTDCLTYTPMP